jgi:8-oxo-dGTP diphosphatase
VVTLSKRDPVAAALTEAIHGGDVAAGERGAPHQVVAALLVREGRVLLCHRSPDRDWYPDVWDFPGGHIEEGETPADALVREVREEVGVVIAAPAEPEFARLVTAEFDCRCWVVREWSGTPINVQAEEHDDLGWYHPRSSDGLRLAHPAFGDLIRRAIGGVSAPEAPGPDRSAGAAPAR